MYMFEFPEKVLRNLMDRIKSQREDWVNSHSILEVGESTLPGQPRQPLIQGMDTQPPGEYHGIHTYTSTSRGGNFFQVQVEGGISSKYKSRGEISSKYKSRGEFLPRTSRGVKFLPSTSRGVKFLPSTSRGGNFFQVHVEG